MNKINVIEEINSAGNCFWATYRFVGGNSWEINIYTDDECNDLIESYVIPILALPKWNEKERRDFIDDTILHSVKYTIERL